jgi:hypothetical protein
MWAAQGAYVSAFGVGAAIECWHLHVANLAMKVIQLFHITGKRRVAYAP